MQGRTNRTDASPSRQWGRSTRSDSTGSGAKEFGERPRQSGMVEGLRSPGRHPPWRRGPLRRSVDCAELSRARGTHCRRAAGQARRRRTALGCRLPASVPCRPAVRGRSSRRCGTRKGLRPKPPLPWNKISARRCCAPPAVGSGQMADSVVQAGEQGEVSGPLRVGDGGWQPRPVVRSAESRIGQIAHGVPDC